MKAIRIRKRIESVLLDLPEVADVLGKTVDIIIIVEDTDLPPKTLNLAALDALAGHDIIDDAAILDLRRISSL